MLSWVHFGDLHVSHDDSYESVGLLERLVSAVNTNVAHAVEFAYLPGDNANNGKPEQYAKIRSILSSLRLPTNAIPGDHDFEPGSLETFHRELGVDSLPKQVTVKGHRCLFLDIVSAGEGGPDFRLGAAQTEWIAAQLAACVDDKERPVVFMHAYPGDLAEGGEALAHLFASAGVLVVDTGHTHYNELLNDGSVIYAATRSTGQIEEDDGRAGVAIVTVDASVVSWRFQPVSAAWPLVMITTPADRRLVTDPADQRQVPVGNCEVRAKVFGQQIAEVVVSIGEQRATMQPVSGEHAVWQAELPRPPDVDRYQVTVVASDANGNKASDTIDVLSRQGAGSRAFAAAPPGTDAHAVGEWADHGLLGSQLGPNKKGRAW
ncbi:metallophosphoesterase [Burkholderia sp. PAMC 28687]|uniref:metallophosphoesterase family protein n=1 Tax=Burkholderia sp. PAMC 28687 TaxID=1795874 RepID=UPI00078443A0|nr:metallophosphoesterase [Burkholderia sp. PAMC 28687]AMM17619.1 metallophosphoesterase [Burkholderia sp. PAMC 28687]